MTKGQLIKALEALDYLPSNTRVRFSGGVLGSTYPIREVEVSGGERAVEILLCQEETNMTIWDCLKLGAGIGVAAWAALAPFIASRRAYRAGSAVGLALGEMKGYKEGFDDAVKICRGTPER